MPDSFERPFVGLVKTDPAPEETVAFRWSPEQWLRQRGVGGWSRDHVARGKETVRWEGTPIHEVYLELFFDEVRRPPGVQLPSVEAALGKLHRWGLPVVAGDPASTPPLIQVRYGHGQQMRWVIQDIVYRGDVRRDGRRVQSDVSVELWEASFARLALSPVEAAAAQAPSFERPTDEELPRPAGSRSYTVRAGDTLIGIASRELGDPGRFMEIYALNSPPLVSPDVIVAGQVLTLPAS